MRCSNAKILISASLDGELSRRDQLSLEQHLASCAECAQEKSEFAGLRDVMSMWPDEEPSEWMAMNFSQKLEQFQQERLAMKPARPRWVLGLAASGAAAVLVMVGFMLHGMLAKPSIKVAIEPPPHSDRHNNQANSANKQVGSEQISNNQVTGEKPVAGTDEKKPPATNVVKPNTDNEYKPAKKPVEMARADIGYRSNNYRPADNLGSRKYHTTSHQPKVDIDQIRVNEMRVVMAVAAEGVPVSKVADNLNEAGIAMNESVERVRGTLQRAVDLSVSEASATEKFDLDNDGGSTL